MRVSSGNLPACVLFGAKSERSASTRGDVPVLPTCGTLCSRKAALITSASWLTAVFLEVPPTSRPMAGNLLHTEYLQGKRGYWREVPGCKQQLREPLVPRSAASNTFGCGAASTFQRGFADLLPKLLGIHGEFVNMWWA
jgi:hypothetical protein